MRKGIILAGGNGSRLYPLTKVVSKQLLPVYNKPLIFYPIATLIEAGIKEILIITKPEDQKLFKKLLGSGKQFDVKFEYTVQEKPNGLAEALILAENFINNKPSCLILGDNIFYGSEISHILKKASKDYQHTTIFTYEVRDPERYGVAEVENGKVINIIEKPNKPKTNLAVTGLYFYDKYASSLAKKIKPSKRGELEITDLNRKYINLNKIKNFTLNQNSLWLDTGTYESLLQASQFIQAIEKRTGKTVGPSIKL